MCELVSGSRIPCKRGKNREFSRERADFMKTGAQSCNNFNALGLNFPAKAIREFFRCYTSTQRRPEKPLVDTGGQVDSGVVDDSPWIFVRSGARRTDSGRAGWPCGAPGGAAGERDCSFERRLELRGGRVGAFVGRRHGARVVRGLSEAGHGGIEEFRP